MPSSPSSNSPSKRDILYHPALVWLFRILVGATFIVSGFAKSIDPWGSFYKISEYFDVWGWDIPHALVVLGAFALGCSEFVLGCLLFFGCYRRVGVWLMMLMMCFMLPLTLYIAIASPVADCGCFGDFLVISNNATFVKNIFLTLMLVYLIMFNAR
ncbi:MauE/DoxX family redox-associated membrane protein, partial [uncultured Duncaniella sp.]